MPSNNSAKRVRRLTDGKVYEVHETHHGGYGYVRIRDDQGRLTIFSARWFEPTMEPYVAPGSQEG